MRIKDPTQLVVDRYLAGYQFMWLVSDEFHRVTASIKAAAKKIRDADPNETLDVVVHDKFSGFYRGQPPITQPQDQTNKALFALPYMMASNDILKKLNGAWTTWKATDNVIFVLKDWESELFLTTENTGPKLVQFIRNAIHSNMGSGKYYKPSMEQGTRGKRLLIFVTTTDKMPANLPELKPITIPLPEEDQLKAVVDRIFTPLEKKYEDTKGKKNPAERDGLLVPPKQKIIIAKSLTGLADQASEDTLSLGVVKLLERFKGREVDNLDELLDVIETEKGVHVAGIPGLTYFSKESIQNIELPGYELLIRFLQARSQISPELAAKHNLKPLQGFTIVGGPGLGKTMMLMLAAKVLNRMLLLWSLGESKDSKVGNSEATSRRVISTAQSLSALIGLDDIDKGSLGGAGGSSYQGDGGTTENIIQMVLTEQSAKHNKAIWGYTANRVQNLRPELIRPGRMDAVFYVQRPDPLTRLRVAQTHIRQRNFELTKKELEILTKLCRDSMNEWTPAEIESVVQDTAFESLYAGKDRLDMDVFAEKVGKLTPMAQQPAFQADWAEMEKMSSQFIKVGRVEEDGKAKIADDSGRAERL